MANLMDESGKRYNNLTVIKLAEIKQYPSGSKRFWECKCDCGNTIITPIGPLKNGRTKSCGCYRKKHPNNKKHGKTNTRLFRIWANMVNRCTNNNSPRYKDYGGRGINVCPEWCGDDGSNNFMKWAIQNGYKESLTLDRIDNDGNYSPQNCRWATNKMQQTNKRNNHYINYLGQTHCVSEWSEITGINYRVILYRLKSGWNIADALTIPTGSIKRYRNNKKEG